MKLEVQDIIGIATINNIKITSIKVKLAIMALKLLYSLLKIIGSKLCPKALKLLESKVRGADVEDIESVIELIKEYEKTLESEEEKEEKYNSVNDFQVDISKSTYEPIEDEGKKSNSILIKADYSTLRDKYMTESGIKLSEVDMILETENPLDIWGRLDLEVADMEYGYFPIIITTDNKVYHGGHGGRGGRGQREFRNTGLSRQHAIDYGVPMDKIKYWFVVRTEFEGRGRKVYGRTKLVKV